MSSIICALSWCLLLPLLTFLFLADPGFVRLPPGETHLSRPLALPATSTHLRILGDPAGSTLVLDPDFQGAAAIAITGGTDVELSGFTIIGNRSELKSDWYLPLNEAAFADFYSANGILVRNSHHVVIRKVRFRLVRAFPVLVNASSAITIDNVDIEDSGTLNRAGRNNTTGGILLEEGVSQFEVRNSRLSSISGNAIWTHSYSRSPRQSAGHIHGNTIQTVGRDAIQIGHATNVLVENNDGASLGFPTSFVDVENHGVAVALDTAGNVDHTTYRDNHFTDVNGQCIDLDGFHHGDVTANSCINEKPADAYPASHYGIVFGNNHPAADSSYINLSGNTLQGFAYGAVFVIGTHNTIRNNRFLDVNRAHCGETALTARCNYALAEQPLLLKSGIYLAANGGRPATTRDNVIRGNTITGFGIPASCVASDPAVSLAANTISGNICTENTQ